MKAEQLLNDLGLIMGLSGLAFNDEGCARLVFDDGLVLNLESDADTGQLQIYSDLGPLPSKNRENFFLMLLEGNIFQAETHGATLAVDAVQQQVVLCRALTPDDLSLQSFSNIIEAFVNAVAQWRAKLDGSPTSPEAISMASIEVQPMHYFIRG
jgi:hypothetical protein